MNTLTVTMKIIALFLCTSVIFYACSRDHKHQSAPYDRGKVRININLLEEGVPVFYSFGEGDESIDFFVMKVKDEIHSYFDACNDCYQGKLGFRFEDGTLICNICNVSHPFRVLKDGFGGCHPLRLKGTLAGTVYEIDKEDLMQGKKYF